MSDTISEFGHLSQGQKPLHAVTDSELAKPEVYGCGSASFRKDESFLWHSNTHRHATTNNNFESLEVRDACPRPQYHNLRMIKRYDEVAHYETHFLSPYDDCPLSIVKDSVSFPHFSLGYRPKQDFSPVRPDMAPPDSATPKIFVQETRYDVRQAYQRRSNETIASSVQSSREDISKSCKHNHSGTSVWQCDCNETENVWIRKLREKKMSEDYSADGQKSGRADNQKGSKVEGYNRLEGQNLSNWPVSQRTSRSDVPCHAPQAPQQNSIPQPSNYQNMQFSHLQIAPKETLRYDEGYRRSKEELNYYVSDMKTIPFYGDDNMFLGSDQRYQFQEKIVSGPKGQYGIANPVKDPHLPPDINAIELKPRGHYISENRVASTTDTSVVETRPSESEGKKPLRSSLKSPSDGLKQKLRRKHITQKVVSSGDKKKSKGKDNVMVTSL